MLTPDQLRSLPGEELRLLVTLHQVSTEKRNRSMSKQELALRAGLSIEVMAKVFERLTADGHILVDKGKVVLHADGTTFEIPLTEHFKDTEAELIRENQYLRKRNAELENQESSGLADKVSPEAGKTIRLVEDVLRRGLTYQEVFYLSELITRYGPARVMKAVSGCRGANDPLKAAWQMLVRGSLGSQVKQPEMVRPVKFWEPPANHQPYG